MICINSNQNFTPICRNKVSFTATPSRLNLKSVKESLCTDYFEKQISPFDNPVFYKYLSSNEKKLDSILSRIYRRKLPKYDSMLSESNIDKKHRVLLVDPEVTAHIEELTQFVKEKQVDTSKLSPFELRKQFSDHLGTETVYRGLYAQDSKEVIDTLKKDGIYPKICDKKENVSDILNYYLSGVCEPVLNVFSRIEDVIRGRKSTEFMSVSSIYDVSASVAKNGTNNASTPVVVAKVDVPRLSVIKQRGDFSPRRTIDKDVLVIGDKKFDYETKREDIEAFIPFHISGKNAEFNIDTTTPDYRWA